MTRIASNAVSEAAIDLPGLGPFDSRQWLNYFEKNKEEQASISLPETLIVEDALRKPLLQSLQRFQIGETGDGRHLRSFAKRIGDPIYLKCIDLFVKEEQVHGQILAEIIRAMDGSLLSWHWTDFAFIVLRRMFGLKTEIFIILIAEVIGKCFYKAVSDKIKDERLSNAFAMIVCDEIGHLRFHSEFLNHQMRSYPWTLKCMIHYAWSMIFYTACFVFILDHKATLAALEVPTADFIGACSRDFQRAAICAFGAEY